MRYLSLFSGMEAAHLAWSPLGWECVGVAEVDPAPCALLRHRLPHVPNLGDVTTIADAAIAKLGRIDVVIGGSPCQDMSVAGKRAGLAGSRSSLFHEQLRIFNAARHLCGARWLVWENVPGAFSSNEGRDFALVVGALAGCDLDVPADGWGNEGVALGDAGLVEWAVLDAQWFGVAQRRRRVFAVLDTGNWFDRSPVLLERDSLRGDSAPSRETRQAVARGVGCSFGVDLQNIRMTGDATGTIDAEGQSRGNRGYAVLAFDTTQITSAANYSNPQPGDPCHPLAVTAHSPAIAFGCKDSDPSRSVSDDVSPTLRAMGHAASHANAGGQVAVAFQTRGQDRVDVSEETAYALLASGGDGGRRHEMNIQTGMQVRRLTPRECERLQGAPDDWTLVPKLGKPRKQRKNEPDIHYADYLYRHSGGSDQGPMMADGPRYKMLGNSFAVPVIRWIGEQIQRAHGVSEMQEAA